jgi:hypothetical protein
MRKGDVVHADHSVRRARLAKRVILLVLLVIGIGSVLALVANQTTLAIAFHEWQMERAYRRDEGYDQYEYHRDRLVGLGAIHRMDYRFGSLRNGTPERRMMFRKMLSRQCPAHIDFVSEVMKHPELVELTIWCRPDDVPEWHAFLKLHDVESK